MKARILWAHEDEISITLRDELHAVGDMEVEAAADALECLHLLDEFQPHVLVVPAGLAWGGMTVLDRIRRQPDEYQVPHVLVIETAGGDRRLEGGSIATQDARSAFMSRVAEIVELHAAQASREGKVNVLVPCRDHVPRLSGAGRLP